MKYLPAISNLRPLALSVLISSIFLAACNSTNTPLTPISQVEAQNITTAMFPGSTPIVTALTTAEGTQAWRIELDNGIVVLLDAQTGALIRRDNPPTTNPPVTNPPATNPPVTNPPATGTSISFEQARQIALEQYPGTNVIEIDLTTNQGRRAWDVHLSNGIAVYVDANTGNIIEIEPFRPTGNPPVTNPPVTNPPVTNPPATGTSISFEQARQIALEQYPGTTVVDIDLERERGRRVWDVELSNGIAVYVDANSGVIVEIEPIRGDWDNDRDDWDDNPPATGTSISFEQARQIALEQYPGTTVVDIDLERERGRRVWDVELSNGIAVYVDANSGVIVEIEPIRGDWDDDRDDWDDDRDDWDDDRDDRDDWDDDRDDWDDWD